MRKKLEAKFGLNTPKTPKTVSCLTISMNLSNKTFCNLSYPFHFQEWTTQADKLSALDGGHHPPRHSLLNEFIIAEFYDDSGNFDNFTILFNHNYQ